MMQKVIIRTKRDVEDKGDSSLLIILLVDQVLTEVVLALEAVVVVLVEVEHLEDSKRW